MTNTKLLNKNERPTECSAKNSKLRQATETKLIEAAEKVFADHGFRGATTRHIAQEANVNIALINRYFDGKYGLFMSVLDKRIKGMREIALNYPAQSTFSKECYQFLLMRFNYYQSEVNFFKIVLSTLLTDEKFLRKFQDALINFDENTELEQRLEMLKQNNKLDAKLKLSDFSEIISLYIFGSFVGDRLTRDLDDKEIEAKLKKFVKLTCLPYEI